MCTTFTLEIIVEIFKNSLPFYLVKLVNYVVNYIVKYIVSKVKSGSKRWSLDEVYS